MNNETPNSNFLPTATVSALQRRAAILSQIRRFFDERGFFEVEVPLLSWDIVVDRHLHPISLAASSVTGRSDEAGEVFLQTSPEFGMKRLLTGGAEAIYQIGKAFRQGESGRQHNPEFTILEWYRVGDDMPAGMRLLDELIQTVLACEPAERLSYREAFLQYARLDPFEATDRALSQAARMSFVDSVDRDECLNVILSEQVEPHLGFERPTLLFDYPASQSALAVVRDKDVPFAERFEIYVDGMELANGYHELLDANELLKRNKKQNQLRESDGSLPLPEESRLQSAMQHGLPPCAGVALGVDRLVMLSLGVDSIDEVIAFPFDRA